MNIAYIALGANIEPRKKCMDSALKELAARDSVFIQKESSIYETAPVGYANQADFLNMVIEVNTSLTSIELMLLCQKIEHKMGRDRKIRNGPRTIDLDILVYNQENSKMENLILPHPRMHERAFVLIPLNEVAPNLILPTWNKRVVYFINKLPESDIKDVTKWMQSESVEE